MHVLPASEEVSAIIRTLIILVCGHDLIAVAGVRNVMWLGRYVM